MAVYWIGQDGNVWVANNDGSASNIGKPRSAPSSAGVDAEWGSVQGNQIRDPALGSASNSGGGSGGGGGAAPPPKKLNQAGIDNTQRTIDQIPGLLADALRSEKTQYGNTVRLFREQEGQQRKEYDGSTVTNQQNYDANFMDSIRSGIKGLGGLMSLLRGTGAIGGSAEDEARDTVGGVTSQDIRGGADTQKENQSSLDTALGKFLTELGRKRAQNEDAYENNVRAAKRESQTQLQELFGKMAGFYGDVGDEANSNKWMNRAGELTPSIARNSRTRVSPYDKAPVAVQAPELTAFADPTQPSIETAPSGEVGAGLFTISEPRRRREATTTAPVGV